VNPGDLPTRAADWAAHDPDPTTRAELTALIRAAGAGEPGAYDDLADRFRGPLEFGTAGLRGAVGAGETRMNVAVVSRASAGLARYLLDVVGPDARVVLGCDARRGSSEFADAAAAVLAGAGVTVVALPKRLPTPLVAYAVRALDADAGVMITASHNPAADNGYKVYLGGRAVADDNARGVQIVAPADTEIAARIAAAPPADELPRGDAVTEVSDELLASYLDRVAGYRTTSGVSPIRVVLTAMHGVGGPTALAALHRAGITDVHPVTTQQDPDPDFPTVPFPNPEEPGALDAAIGLAEQVNADVVIALDPDADRCAVAVPGPGGSARLGGVDAGGASGRGAEGKLGPPHVPGGWRVLTGDETGALLGIHAATDSARSGDTLAASVVSSRLLGRIAAAHGLRHAVTLTGFKWIARVPGLRFGYEEAIGYCTDPAAVRDKDGIGAAVRMVTLVEELRSTGRGPLDLLDELACAHGLHVSQTLSFRFDDLDEIATTMDRLRRNGIDELAGSMVRVRHDLLEPVAAREVDGIAALAGLPPTDALLYLTNDGDRLIVRPSGTEPKLKCYLEVVLSCGDEVPHAAAAARLAALGNEVRALLN
jgi:phosphomannomutase